MLNNIFLLAINKQNIINALTITWKGMLAIFLVMGLIYLVVIVLNKVTAIPKQKLLSIFKKKGDNTDKDND